MPDSSDSPAAPDKKSPGESPSGSSPEQAAGKPPAAAPSAEPLSLVPRARSATRESAAPAAPEGAPAGAGDFLQWMKMFTAAMETAPAEAPKAGAKLQRSALPKSQRKFQRFDREPGAPEKTGGAASPLAEPSSDAGTADEESTLEGASNAVDEEEKGGFATSRPVPIALTGGPSNRRGKPVTERRPYFWMAIQLGAFLLLIVSFVLGRASVPKATDPVKNAAPAAPGLSEDGETVNVLSPEAAKMIDEAMAAEQDRKFSKAADILLKVQKENSHVRDLDFRLAMLAIEDNDVAKALPLLNLSIAQGEQMAAAYKLRGTILNRRGGANRGMNDFASSTLVDPFSAENFYFWGEALRKLGKPQAALTKLQQAIDRLREPALEAQYRLKIRLTQVELGIEQEFAAEMATQLAQTPPAPDWLLTAAAVELHRNNAAAAAGYLEKATQYMDKDLFEMRMRDYFFFGYRFEKPLARFFAFAASSPAAASSTPGSTSAGAPAPGSGETATVFDGAPVPTPAALPTGTP